MYFIKNKQSGLYVKDTGANFGLTTDRKEALQFNVHELQAFFRKHNQEDGWEAEECLWVAKTPDGYYLEQPLFFNESLPTSQDINKACRMNYDEMQVFQDTNNAGQYTVELAGPGGERPPKPVNP
jgi:hypothetical protein